MPLPLEFPSDNPPQTNAQDTAPQGETIVEDDAQIVSSEPALPFASSPDAAGETGDNETATEAPPKTASIAEEFTPPPVPNAIIMKAPERPSTFGAERTRVPTRRPMAGAIGAALLLSTGCAAALYMDRSARSTLAPQSGPAGAATSSPAPPMGFTIPETAPQPDEKGAASAPNALAPNALAQLPGTTPGAAAPKPGAPAAALKPAEAAFNAAVTAQKSGNTTAAIAGYRETIRLDPKILPARTNLALLYLGTNRPAEGLEQLRAARRLDPKNPALPFQIAQVLLQLQRPKEALEPLKASVRLAPQNPGGHALLAQLYQAGGKPQDALREWKSVMKLAPKDANAPFSAGMLEMQLRHASAAEALLKRAATLEPRDPRGPLMLARAQAAQGKLPQAEQTAAAAVHKFPKVVDLWTLLAQVRRDRKNLSGAIAALKSAVSALPANAAKTPAAAQLWVELGQTQLQLKRPKDALASMTRATELVPKAPEAWTFRAEARQANGDARGAISDYDRALKLDPNRLGDRRALARLLGATGQFSRARVEYTRYVKAQPKDPEALMEWAAAEEGAKQFTAASKLWDRTAALLPRNPLPALQSGRLLRTAGNDAAAANRYRAALKMAPKDPNALLGIATVEEATGQTPRALAHWKQLVTSQPQFPTGIEGYLRTGQKLKQDDEVAQTLAPLVARHDDNVGLARGYLAASQRAGTGSLARDYVKTAWEKRKSPALRRALDEFDLARAKERLKELESRPTPTARPIEEPKVDGAGVPADAAPKP